VLVKFADLSPYTKRALSLTGKRIDDADRRAPTWCGYRWHLARLATEEQVLHEVAHWLVATPAQRVLQNYGLGIDPYGGPLVRRYLHGESRDRLESVASFLTRHLLRCAAPGRARGAIHLASRPTSGRITEASVSPPWACVAHLAALGIDLADPLRRFEAEARIGTQSVAAGAL
jgi:hypothetical protein